MAKTKHEMREAAIKRLKNHINCPWWHYRAMIRDIVGDDLDMLTGNECVERVIDLLTDDESYEDDAYTMGPRDADGIFWFRGDMSDSPWGVIEGVVYDCTRREWLVRGHDISAPWVPAGSIRHAPMRTATQRENDLIRLIKDAAKDYQHEQSEVEWQKEMYRSMSDHVISNTMLLPHDANDEVIHIGDELTNPHHAGSFTVEAIGGNGSVPHVVYFRCNNGKLGFHYANQCHHYHKPTVEDVLREFGDEVQRCCDTEDTVAEYAKKLQLREEGCE